VHRVLIEFVQEFEVLYYQRNPDRLHFVRQSIHLLIHLAPETVRVGLLSLLTQWPLERTIGNLGEEIKQPSNPYANLSERGLRRSQVNALKAMIPDLEPEKGPPRGSKDLGNGYRLLRARDTVARWPPAPDQDAIRTFLVQANIDDPPDSVYKVRRWARLALPNGQIARSRWKERERELENIRMARNVQV
jgi:hypothetical protein